MNKEFDNYVDPEPKDWWWIINVILTATTILYVVSAPMWMAYGWEHYPKYLQEPFLASSVIGSAVLVIGTICAWVGYCEPSDKGSEE